MKNKTVIFTYIGVFLISISLAYLLFDYFVPVKKKTSNTTSPNIYGPKTTGGSNPAEPTQKKGVLTFEGPKTEECPLNGQKYSKDELAIWEKRRPLVVMIENHSDARPQSGLNSADVVYEAMAEGGITRFMAVFLCGIVSGTGSRYDVGPVRSARTYFLDMASEYSDYPLYTHVGAANCSAPQDPVTKQQAGACTTNIKAQAMEQISKYGWMNKGTWSDLSQFSLPYKVCRREKDRTGAEKADEHTMYCSTTELWNIASERGLTNMTVINNKKWDVGYRKWVFEDGRKKSDNSQTISFDFWGDVAYKVVWEYDPATNSYQRSNGGSKQIDFNTGQQLSTQTLVIQFTKESRSIDEHKHNLYEMIGNGKGIMFKNGEKIDLTWSKTSRTARTIFKDSKGKEVAFNRGRIWIEVLATTAQVNYESGSSN